MASEIPLSSLLARRNLGGGTDVATWTGEKQHKKTGDDCWCTPAAGPLRSGQCWAELTPFSPLQMHAEEDCCSAKEDLAPGNPLRTF